MTVVEKIRTHIVAMKERVAQLETALNVIEAFEEPVAPPSPKPLHVHISEILYDMGALTTAEIAEEALKRGYKTQSKDFPNVVYQMCRNHPRLKKLPSGHWALR